MTAAATTPQTFDHFRAPQTPGLGSLGKIGTGLLIAGTLITIALVILVNLVTGLVFGAFAGLALKSVSTRDRHGVSLLEKVSARTMHSRAVRSGTGEYRSGPLTKLGNYRLPGVLADTELIEYTDQAGEPFALVHTPRPQHWAVTVEYFPDSASLVDHDTRAADVDRWGDCLSFLAYEPDLLQVMVTTETAPDDGASLRAEISHNADPGASDLAAAVMGEISTTWPTDSASVRTWVTLTFNGRHGKKARTGPEMGAALTHRLPEIVRTITGTGAGQGVLLDAEQVAQIIRVDYDPSAARCYATGHPTVTRWESVGPTAASRQWDHYRHSGAVSVSWSMSGILGRVSAEGLAPLLHPHPGIARKRVSLIYTPHAPAESQRLASTDLKAAEYRVESVRKPSATARKNLTAADVTATEEAHGNALVDFAAIVTCTVDDVARIPDAVAVIDSLGPAARLQLRREDGAQPSAFAQGLPVVGLITAEHSMIPRALRESL